jgi:tetratricopeptide (TPR) repeat protein
MVRKTKQEVVTIPEPEEVSVPAAVEQSAPPHMVVEPSVPQSAPRGPFIERAIVSLLVGLTFLLPLFFLPLPGAFVGFAKNVLLTFTTLTALGLALVLWISRGQVVLPRGRMFSGLFFIAGLSAFSSVFSGAFHGSFFGTGAETTTSFELLVLCVLTYLFAIFFRTNIRIMYVFLACFGSAFFVFLFQIIHLIVPTVTFAGMLPLKTANVIGEWSDLGIYSGVIILLSLLALEKIQRQAIGIVGRRMLYGFLAVSLFFYSVALSSGSWAILGFLTLFLSIFFFFQRTHHSTEQVRVARTWLATPTFFVAALSLLFIFVGSSVNATLFELLHIPPVQDVRPSWAGTVDVYQDIAAEGGRAAIVGVGPNRFFVPWQRFRPVEVNYTPWWSVDFNEGVGTIPTSLITVGVLGFLGWIVFLLTFFAMGVRVLRTSYARLDMFGQYIIVASFVCALYLWIAAFVGTVSTVPYVLAFLFTGLLYGVLSANALVQVREYAYHSDPQKGFTLTVVLLLLLGCTAGFWYHAVERTRAQFAYYGALVQLAQGDLEQADAQLQQAIALAPSDASYRSLSTISTYRAKQLLSRTDLPADELRQQFGVAFRASIAYANDAIKIDSENSLNWITLGGAYAVLASFGVENVSGDAYVQAKQVYERAANVNPFNPQIPYLVAQIALLNGNLDDAEQYIQKALSLKNDYADALVTYSHIQDKKGNTEQAAALMEQAFSVDSSDPEMLFQLGYARYKNGNYEGAASILEKLLGSIPDYANAKYVLGLTYASLDRTDDALKEFRDIERTNPERTDVTKIITNLQNGAPPLSEVPSKKLEAISTNTATSGVPNEQ